MRLLALALTLISTQALAVPYTFQGDSWQMLRNPTTWATMCYSTDASCDVPAGTYTLIDYITSPPMVTTIEVQAQTGPVTVTKECDYHNSFPGRTCLAQCPSGMQIKRIKTCHADGGLGSDFIGTNFSSSDTRLWCNIGPSEDPVEMLTEIVCE